MVLVNGPGLVGVYRGVVVHSFVRIMNDSAAVDVCIWELCHDKITLLQEEVRVANGDGKWVVEDDLNGGAE